MTDMLSRLAEVTLGRLSLAAVEPGGAPAAAGWMPEPLRWQLGGVAVWQLGALVVALVVALILRSFVTYVLREKFKAWVGRLGRRWMEETFRSLEAPLGVLTIGLVLLATVEIVRFPERLDLVLQIAIQALVGLTVVWCSYRLVDVLSGFMQEKADATDTKLDDQLVPLVRKSMKVLVVVLAALVVLQNLDVDVGSLLAGLGLGGLAFALAAKDTCANLFGSLMIFTDRPFQIGDWVIIGGAEGTVEEVGFRSTRIRTFYNSLITLPNQKIADTMVDNMGQRQYRRVKQVLGVEYGTTPEQIQAFCEGIRAIIRAHPDTRKDFYLVYLTGFGPSSLDILVYAFVEVPDWQAELTAKHQLFLEFARLARELGVSFAFPTQTLHLASQAQAQAVEPSPLLAPEELAARVDAFAGGGSLSRPRGPQLTRGYLATPEGETRGEADG